MIVHSKNGCISLKGPGSVDACEGRITMSTIPHVTQEEIKSVFSKSEMFFQEVKCIYNDFHVMFLRFILFFYSQYSSSSLRRMSALSRMYSRKRMNVRMICTFTETTRLLRRTLESIAMPCSVKAIGTYLTPFLSTVEITICDLHHWASSFERENMKSSGKRSAFLLTA